MSLQVAIHGLLVEKKRILVDDDNDDWLSLLSYVFHVSSIITPIRCRSLITPSYLRYLLAPMTPIVLF